MLHKGLRGSVVVHNSYTVGLKKKYLALKGEKCHVEKVQTFGHKYEHVIEKRFAQELFWNLIWLRFILTFKLVKSCPH